MLATLGYEAHRWATRPPRPEPVGSVEIVAVRAVGKVSGIIDGSGDGVPDVAALQAVYNEGDGGAEAVIAEIRRLGPKAAAEQYGIALDTAKSIASGRKHPQSRTLAAVLGSATPSVVRTCSLDGCDEPVRGKAQYHSEAHKKRAYRQRQSAVAIRAWRTLTAEHACRGCGVLMSGSADTGDGTCSRCAQAKKSA
jgi:hypothetical protein